MKTSLFCSCSLFLVSGCLVVGSCLIQFFPEMSYQQLRCRWWSDIKSYIDFKQSTCFTLLPYSCLLWPLLPPTPQLLWYILSYSVNTWVQLSALLSHLPFFYPLFIDIFVTWNYRLPLISKMEFCAFIFLFLEKKKKSLLSQNHNPILSF